VAKQHYTTTLTWTLTDSLLKRIETFEMWTYRKLLKISWVERITNQEVLLRLHKTTELVITTKQRKLEHFGHIMRHPEKYALLHLIIQGKIMGKRSVGRTTS